MTTLSSLSPSNNKDTEICFTPDATCPDDEEVVYRFLQGMNTTKKEQIAMQFLTGHCDNNNKKCPTPKPESADEQIVYNFLRSMSSKQKRRLSVELMPILQEMSLSEEMTSTTTTTTE